MCISAACSILWRRGKYDEVLASFGLSSGLLEGDNRLPDATVWSPTTTGSLLYVGGDSPPLPADHTRIWPLSVPPVAMPQMAPASPMPVTSVVPVSHTVVAVVIFPALRQQDTQNLSSPRLNASDAVVVTNNSSSSASSVNPYKSWANNYVPITRFLMTAVFINTNSDAGVDKEQVARASGRTKTQRLVPSLSSKNGTTTGDGKQHSPDDHRTDWYIVFMSSRPEPCTGRSSCALRRCIAIQIYFRGHSVVIPKAMHNQIIIHH